MNIKKISQFSLGPIGSAALGFATLPLVAWFFSSEDVGALALLQVLIGLSSVIFSLGLDQAYIREYHNSLDKVKLWKISVFPGFLLITFVGVLIFFNPYFVSSYIFHSDDYLISFLFFFIIVFNFFSRFFSVIFRMNEESVLYSVFQIIPKLLNIIFLLISVFFLSKSGFLILLLACFTSSLFSFCVGVWYTRKVWIKALKENFLIADLYPLIKFGFPLTLSALAIWGLNSIDRFFLMGYSGLDELGVYSIAVTFAGFAMVLQNVFSTLWAPIVYKEIKENNNSSIVDTVSNYIVLVVIFVFSLTGVFSWVIDYIVPAKYSDVKYMITACMAVPLFYIWSEVTSIGISIMKKTSFSMLAAVIALLCSAILNYLLVPIHGAKGAAVSCCFSFYLFFIIKTEISIYVWKPFPRLKNYFLATFVCFFSILMALYGDKNILFFIVFWAVILLCTLFFICNTIKKNIGTKFI